MLLVLLAKQIQAVVVAAAVVVALVLLAVQALLLFGIKDKYGTLC
jgi:hypothetical protein